MFSRSKICLFIFTTFVILALGSARTSYAGETVLMIDTSASTTHGFSTTGNSAMYTGSRFEYIQEVLGRTATLFDPVFLVPWNFKAHKFIDWSRKDGPVVEQLGSPWSSTNLGRALSQVRDQLGLRCRTIVVIIDGIPDDRDLFLNEITPLFENIKFVVLIIPGTNDSGDAYAWFEGLSRSLAYNVDYLSAYTLENSLKSPQLADSCEILM